MGSLTIGWGKLEHGKHPYAIGLPAISEEEEQLLCQCIDEFGNAAKQNEIKNRQQATKFGKEILEGECAREEIELEGDQKDYLLDYLVMHVWGFCFIDRLLEDDAIEEIAVTEIGRCAYVYIHGSGWKSTDFGFTSESCAIETINKMARSIGRRITFQTPRLNAVLPDGTRLHATIPPISKTEITLRKFRASPITAPQLGLLHTASFEALAFLWMVMQSDASVLVCGNTASGKTTTLNALFNFVPASERILVIEETPEINIAHRHVAHLISNEELGVSMADLVADSLRMRPDRVIVGEVRTQRETQCFVESILSGQARGTYATYHAQSAKEALLRFVAQGVLQVDLNSIDLIIVQRRIGIYRPGVGVEEKRRVVQIAEPCAGEQSNVSDIFSYDWRKDRLAWAKNGALASSRIIEKVCMGHSIRQKKVQFEIAKRAKFLQSLSRSGADLEKTTGAILKFR